MVYYNMIFEKIPYVEGEFVEEQERQYWMDYERISLAEIPAEEIVKGKPILLPVEKIQFDLEETPRYRCRLLIVDDDMQEYVQIAINLKSAENIQSNVHNASSLYALVAGVKNLQEPGWSTRNNRLHNVNLKEWSNFIEQCSNMTIKVVEKEAKFGNYNSFRVVDLQ